MLGSAIKRRYLHGAPSVYELIISKFISVMALPELLHEQTDNIKLVTAGELSFDVIKAKFLNSLLSYLQRYI